MAAANHGITSFVRKDIGEEMDNEAESRGSASVFFGPSAFRSTTPTTPCDQQSDLSLNRRERLEFLENRFG